MRQQHFLLSAKARTLSIKRLHRMSGGEAFALFRELRWGNGEDVTCLCCGSIAKHYFIATRRQWRCLCRLDYPGRTPWRALKFDN